MGNAVAQPRRSNFNNTPSPPPSPLQLPASNLVQIPPHKSPLPSNPSPPPPTTSIPSPDASKPIAFYVPSILPPVLDLSPTAPTPESFAKRTLLSDDPNTNSMALVGMSGVGKTTILCALGRDEHIWAKFTDAVWLIELGHDVTLSSLILQLQTFVKYAFPDLLERFKYLSASQYTHRTMITHLMDRLVTKRVLLLLDDVWDIHEDVYKLVCAMCEAVQGHGSGLMKMLTSTRNRRVAYRLGGGVCAAVDPEEYDSEKSVVIFCCNAGVRVTDVSSLWSENREAMEGILETCGGLPLALSVAGSGVRQLMDPSVDRFDQNAMGMYWERLETRIRRRAAKESGSRHKGLANTLEASIELLDESWDATEITTEFGDLSTAGDLFQSLCIMRKKACLPLDVIKKLWNVSDVMPGVIILSRNSLVSEIREEGKGIVGVCMHDLVLSMCVKLAEHEDGVVRWHARLLDAYQRSTSTKTGDCESIEGHGWWQLEKNDEYMIDNVVRHLLGARRVSEALKLLTDYRWVERMNEDDEHPPYRKVIAEFQLLHRYLEKNEKTRTGRRIVRDIDVIVRAMELCMVPHCMRNRSECAFQIYGRLRDVKSESGIVERLVYGIERYAQRPWACPGRGVLTSGRSLLKRVLALEDDSWSMSIGARGDEVVVGGRNGEVWVLNSRDGSEKSLLVGHEEDDDIADVYVDRSSRLIYSCSSRGRVIIWKEFKKLQSFQAEGLEEDRIKCMQLLPKCDKVVLGTIKGRLFVIDIEDSAIRIVDAHTDCVTSLAARRSGDIIASGSKDGTIRVWDTANFEDTRNVLEGYTARVRSVVFSGDGRLLASGSVNGIVQLWDMSEGKQIWMSSREPERHVNCVLFSRDGLWLYSADKSNRIRVWRVRTGGLNETEHSLRHPSMHSIGSLRIGDHSELLVLNKNRIHVWDTREVKNRNEQVNTFLPEVGNFAVSADGATMLTWNRWYECLEMRNVSDVSRLSGHVICSFSFPRPFQPQSFAVSNDQQVVAFSGKNKCDVHLVDARNGDVLHSFSNLEHYAASSTPDQQQISSPSTSGLLISPSITELHQEIELLSFSTDGSIVSATLLTKPFRTNWTIKRKYLSWSVLSGMLLDEPQPFEEYNTSRNSNIPHLTCKRQTTSSGIEIPKNVIYEHGGKSFTIATMEDNFKSAYYCSNTSRLWVSIEPGGLQYVDLITNNTQFPSRDEPPLPILLRPDPALLEHKAEEIDEEQSSVDESEELYDIFISHAGADRLAIAEPLYALLVALGFKVFLNRVKHASGVKALVKWMNAMKTAKVAVVILSPEFAAQKYTMKELMCFLQRFKTGGERRVYLIPVFYRLTLDDCKDPKLLFETVNEDGKNVFIIEGFLQRMASEKEYNIKDILETLKSLESVTGVENKDGVTNGMSVKHKEKQMHFVRTISHTIVAAMASVEKENS